MIDKMIEEILDNSHCVYKSNHHCVGTREDCESCLDYMVWHKDIVNIAEKYKADKCKWKRIKDSYNGLAFKACNGKKFADLHEFKFCPYCGKEIKIDARTDD